MTSLRRRYIDYVYFDMVKRRLAAQLEQVRTHPVDVYVDLGCYVGYNTDRVCSVLKPRQTIGVEYDWVAVHEANQRGIDGVRHDLNQPLPLKSGLADVVTVFDVLEHLVETWRFITEVYRILKPGGFVLIDSPNLAAWHNIVGLVLGQQPSSGPHLISIADSDMQFVADMHKRDHQITDQPSEMVVASKMHRHIVIPAFRSLRRVLEKAGFIIEGNWGFGYYPLPPLLSNWFCKLDICHAHHYLIKARKPVASTYQRCNTDQ